MPQSKPPTPPTLRRHKSGNYFVRWGGKDHYLGRDPEAAESRYWQQIDEWRRWRTQKKQARKEGAGIVLGVDELIERFLKAKQQENGSSTHDYYEKHLRRFNGMFHNLDSNLIRPSHLNALKTWMLERRYKPKTINHDLTAIRVMFNWGSGLDLVAPISLKGVKNLPVGPVDDESVPEARIRFIVWSAPDDLRPWLAINYLALMRPSEVVRAVKGEGKWIEHGIFRLERGKMDKRVSIKRHLIFSEEALSWFKLCKVHWRSHDNYTQRVNHCSPITPKVFQKSAAAHLVQNHETHPSDAELLLGHVSSRLAVTYYLPAFRRLRGVASRISLGTSPYVRAKKSSA